MIKQKIKLWRAQNLPETLYDISGIPSQASDANCSRDLQDPGFRQNIMEFSIFGWSRNFLRCPGVF